MPTLIKVERFVHKPDWTLSRYFVNDQLFGFGVEDEERVKKVKKETAIPNGRYKLSFRQSPRFSSTFFYHDDRNELLSSKEFKTLGDKSGWRTHDLIWIQDIPNFELVLIHWGNTDRDTDGCYIVGNKIGMVNGREGVLESRANYRKLYTTVFPAIRVGSQEIEVLRAG